MPPLTMESIGSESEGLSTLQIPDALPSNPQETEGDFASTELMHTTVDNVTTIHSTLSTVDNRLPISPMAATVHWDGGGDGTSWSDPLNWDTDALPGADDDVIINVIENPTVIIDGLAGDVSVNSIDSHEALMINCGLVATTGSQTYNGPVILGADTTLDGMDVTFAGTLDSDWVSDRALVISASGVTTFAGMIGGNNRLLDLVIDAAVSTRINGGLVATTGSQTYNGPVILGADTTLDGMDVTFAGTLDSDWVSDRALVISASGVTAFAGVIGGTDPLASLTNDDLGSTELWANVTTSSAQTYKDDVDLKGDVVSKSTSGSDITFARTVDGGHNLTIHTGGSTILNGHVGSNTPLTALTTDYGGTAYVSGDITTTWGITFGDNVTAGISSLLNQRIDAGAGTLDADGNIEKTTAGDLALGGDMGIELGGNVLGGGLTLSDTITFEDDVTADGTGSTEHQRFDAGAGVFWAQGSIKKTTTGGLTLDGDGVIDLDGTVEVHDGSLFLEDDFHASADLLASQDITFAGSVINGELDGIYDQRIDAQTGTLTANGWLHKGDGTLYLKAAGDICLADYIKADSGGVSVISENGKIFTPGGVNDTLNVVITGYSHDAFDAGVDLAYGFGKAAIMIMSRENLNLGPVAELTAYGTYDTIGAVDDRAAIAFLDVPATIGEVPRDEGDPFDIAVYITSKKGNVNVSSPVTITSGAMVIDAFDTVIFGDLFEGSLASGDVGNRLEVVSRITEWLFQAMGRLPYPYGGGLFPPDYTYVLRGAGLGNVDITDGRAWVLVDLTAPIVTVDILLTNDPTPQLTGTVDDPDASIEVTVDGNSYAAVNNGDGTWTLVDDTISPALADGTYDVAVSAIDLAGNVGTDTTTNELVVDSTIVSVTWDIDDNAAYDALTDGLLTMRYLFGFRGDDLIADAVGADANRTTATDIEGYLAEVSVEGMLDTDGNGTDDALTDGLLIMRYLFGFRGEDLIRDAVAPDATRTTSDEIEAFIESHMPALALTSAQTLSASFSSTTGTGIQFSAAALQEVICKEDFETGWSAWTADNGVWEIGIPTSGPGGSHTGVYCVATVLDGDYSSGADSRLESPALDLPQVTGGERLELRFWQWYSYASGDAGYVEISTDGGSSWTELSNPAKSQASSDWSVVAVDLTAYAGQTVRLGFYHSTDATAKSSGWYVDNMEMCHGIPIEQWLPHVPTPEQTDISIETSPTGTTVEVSLVFPNSGYRVQNWGSVQQQGDNFLANAEPEQWTGPSLTVITTL